MLGTYLLVFFGPASVLTAPLLGLSSLETLLFVATVFGATVGCVIVGLGRFSGAHINPAMSVGITLAGMLKRELFIPYVTFQVIGGLLAGLSLRIVFGSLDSSAHLGSTQLSAGITPLEGVLLEVTGTFFLVLSALAAGSFLKRPATQAILVGGTLFVLILFIGPLTGASFNPARSLGPALFSGFLSNQVIYYIGPILGAACAGLAFGMAKNRLTRGKGKSILFVCVENAGRSQMALSQMFSEICEE